MNKIKNALKQSNGNAKEAIYMLCREQGINPETAGNELLMKVAGIPNLNDIVANALSSSPQLKELAAMLK